MACEIQEFYISGPYLARGTLGLGTQATVCKPWGLERRFSMFALQVVYLQFLQIGRILIYQVSWSNWSLCLTQRSIRGLKTSVSSKGFLVEMCVVVNGKKASKRWGQAHSFITTELSWY